MLKPTKHGPQRSHKKPWALSSVSWGLGSSSWCQEARRSRSTWNRQTSAETHPVGNVGNFSRIVLDSMPPKTPKNHLQNMSETGASAGWAAWQTVLCERQLCFFDLQEFVGRIWATCENFDWVIGAFWRDVSMILTVFCKDSAGFSHNGFPHSAFPGKPPIFTGERQMCRFKLDKLT